MCIENISYQSFCWAIGTTSFRTAKLNLKIEEQLLLLNKFRSKYIEDYSSWTWDEHSQELYYDFMKKENFVTGDASRKAKDSREKTSGLLDIGLILNNRTISEAGKELLSIAEAGDFGKVEYFNIDKDSYLYFKQILKTSINVGDNVVRPFLVLAKILSELEHLSFDEFKYFAPLAIDAGSMFNIIDEIKQHRNGTTSTENILFKTLMRMDNYKKAYRVFMDKPVTENLVTSIGMNRKSRNYDKPYYKLYNELISVFLHEDFSRVIDLYSAAKSISQKPGVMWRQLLFTNTREKYVKKHGIEAIDTDCPFWEAAQESEIKRVFFSYMHVYKAMATLSDYFDLNRRYLNITNTIIFEDDTVKLDIMPKYFFLEHIDEVLEDAFIPNDNLQQNINLDQIFPKLTFNENVIYSKLSKDLGIKIESSDQANSYVMEDRYKRFNKLVDTKFDDDTLVELLNCFEEREDDKIEAIVTDDATVPAIFEYILGIIWYKISNRQGKILDNMKLSLDANLLPKAHAAGGTADIIYKYSSSDNYPEHSLLIEGTLTESSTQRRQEMEPVSRHLGNHLTESGNYNDYALFISTYLHPNVISSFRNMYDFTWYNNEIKIEGMKIISLKTSVLKDIIKNNIKYDYLYEVFEDLHHIKLDPLEWQELLDRKATQEHF